MEIEKDGIRVVWSDIGEGWSGDYDEENLDDEPLLRFDVYLSKKRYDELHLGEFPAWSYKESKSGPEWFAPQDSSYCTAMPADTPEDILKLALERIWASVDEDGCERNLEELSWINPGWFKEGNDETPEV